MENDNLYFKIFFPISVYLFYCIVTIIVIAKVVGNPVVFASVVSGLGIKMDSISLYKAKTAFELLLIASLLIPFFGVIEAKKILLPTIYEHRKVVKYLKLRIMTYFAVLIFVMTTTIMWSIRAITSTVFQEYLELSEHSIGIELVTNLVFIFYLIVAFVTVIGIKWFDSEYYSDPEEKNQSASW